MTLTDAERDYLATQRFGRLATVDPGGAPQNNPVGFTYDADTGTIDIIGYNMGATRKFHNVQANDQVAFVVDDLASVDPWVVRGVELRGYAEALVDQPPPQPWASKEIIRIHPQHIFSWGVDPEVEGMQKRTVGAAR